MKQLASVARPARTARQLARIRAIKKVERAIRWHEHERRKRKEIAKDGHESKQTRLRRVTWHKDNVTIPIKEMKRNLTEDYLLGPLRPNRAVGKEAPTYGVLDSGALRRPDIPTRVQQNRNEFLEKKGLEPEYPLVVDDKKYFHIVEGDRVVVINGREKGKIGVVEGVVSASNEVIIKNLNKHYVDSSVFNTPEGENPGAKRKIEISVPIEDVRLVIPYRMPTKAADGTEKYTYQDVVVDKLIMERHTTGKDPFTGIDYGNQEFPEEHRFDPNSGVPISNRYIAGTRRRIQWPWENKVPLDNSAKNADLEQVEEGPSAIGMIKHPVKSLKRLLSKRRASKKESKVKPSTPEIDEEITLNQGIKKIDSLIEKAGKSAGVPSGQPQRKPLDHDDDTGRHRVDVSDHTRSFYPTLVYPPFPNDMPDELRSDIREKEKEGKSKNKEDETVKHLDPSAKDSAEKELVRSKRKQTRKIKTPLQLMKTPLQLRWEAERAKKLEQEKANPKLDKEALLAALGQHMWMQPATRKTRMELDKAQELD